MIVIVMTTLTLSLVSLNITQVGVAEQEVKRIQSELMGSGILTMMFTRQQSNITTTSFQNCMGMNGTGFNCTGNMTLTNSLPYYVATMNTSVDY